MSLTTCLKKAGSSLDEEDKDAIISRAKALRDEGVSRNAASIQAVDEQITKVEGMLGGFALDQETETDRQAREKAEKKAKPDTKAQADRERDYFGLDNQDQGDTGKLQGKQDGLFSRSPSTQASYESRIDGLYSGQPSERIGVRVLDKSDVLDMLGYGDQPVHVAESKVKASRINHKLKAEHWKQIPEWLENPVAVFESDTVEGRLVLVSPETVNGAPILMVLEPNADVGGMDAHLLVNAYDANQKKPYMRWAKDGLFLYGDEKRTPAFGRTSGLQLPRVNDFRQGYGKKIYSDRDLVKYRASQAKPSVSAKPTNTHTPQSLKSAMDKALSGVRAPLEQAGQFCAVLGLVAFWHSACPQGCRLHQIAG